MARPKNGRGREESAQGHAPEAPAEAAQVNNGGTPQQQNGTRPPPAHECRIGRIKVVVWRNDSREHGVWYSVNLVRSYKQGDAWKQAHSFGRDDLLVGAECLRLAFLWIAQQQTGGNASPQQPEGQPNGNGSKDDSIPF